MLSLIKPIVFDSSNYVELLQRLVQEIQDRLEFTDNFLDSASDSKKLAKEFPNWLENAIIRHNKYNQCVALQLFYFLIIFIFF